MEHIGGHLNRTWVDEGCLRFIYEKLEIKNMVDVGCGPGGMKDIAHSLGIEWTGVDGDPEVKQEGVIFHDFNDGKLEGVGEFSLGWSVEFLEHVFEKYQENYMDIFSKCDYVLCTAAQPGWGGHHHVNEQTREYWISVFDSFGLEYDEQMTKEIVSNSTMRRKKSKSFMELSGMFYRNKR